MTLTIFRLNRSPKRNPFEVLNPQLPAHLGRARGVLWTAGGAIELENVMKDGGPAFPSHGSMGEVAQQGMRLRDYFAAAALPACIMATLERANHRNRVSDTDAIEDAYLCADLMLAERDK